MDSLSIGPSKLYSSRLVYGCMRICGDGSPTARERGKAALRAALEAGYTHFDHADIYGGGACESLFAEVLRDEPGIREHLLITSKCGIRTDAPARYDFRREYIFESVEGSLRRLGTDCLDLLLLHRPDYLCEPEEVAAAFDRLKASGKVHHFGVSNFKPSQVAMLQRYCTRPLQVNQVEINIHNISALEDGTLDQCLELGMSPQAWCPLGGVVYPAWGNTFSAETEARIRTEIDRQAAHYDAPDWVVMLAWILMLPSKVLPIIGSTTPERIRAAKQALKLPYSREDWYRLLEARNGQPVP